MTQAAAGVDPRMDELGKAGPRMAPTPAVGNQRWPAGTPVVVIQHTNTWFTGHVTADAQWVEWRKDWSYEVKFDHWAVPNQRYYQHELRRIFR